ncbi:MAG: AAA family ATPase [Woeseiaceae bacterium]
MGNSDEIEGNAQARLIESMLRPAIYPHSVSDVEIVETHISWVVLTGRFAYKIKKAVNFGFLDFSTLERRLHFCEEELWLNSRRAPQLYLGVVPISGSPEEPLLDGQGEIFEYALKMRQFPQDAQLDRQLDDGALRDEDLCRLAETVAADHEQARVIEYANDKESVGKVKVPMQENFAPVERAIDMDLLRRVRQWTADSIDTLKPTLIQRRRDGFVRECHGDLHLSNLVRLDSGIVAFDCVEFSADLRNIDVLSDIAFLVMDLTGRARQDLATTFLNRYLERTGDYAGMRVFGLYYVYHAMIRAKVAAIRSTERSNEGEREKDIEAVKHNLAVAVRWIGRSAPRLIAMHGYSGSGKTWLSSQLLSRLPAIRVRSDIERKRLFGLGETDTSNSKPGEGSYTAISNTAVYARLFELAGGLLTAGFQVIIDAAFLRKDDREALVALAQEHKAGYAFVSTEASAAELGRRLQRRGASGSDASEANITVLRHQRQTSDPLGVETGSVVHVTTDGEVDADDVIKSLNSFA